MYFQPITWGETKNLPVCWWSFVACRRGRYGSCWRMRCRSQKLRGCFRTSFWILDLDKGKPQDSQGHGTFMLNSFGDLFFSIPKFPLWHCYEWLMGNPNMKSINVLIEFRAARPLYITPRLLFATCWPNTSAWLQSCPSCEVHPKHSTMGAIQWLILHHFAHGFVTWTVDCDNESCDFQGTHYMIVLSLPICM